MDNVIQFPKGNEKFDRMEWLAEQIGGYGFDVSIIRNSHNWVGDLAFTPSEKIPDNAVAIFQLMQEMRTLWDSDAALRSMMYEYYFSLGSLYYEASTSNAVSFHENNTPGGDQC